MASSTSDGSITKSKRKLSGAGQKRMRKLVEKGYNREDARKLASVISMELCVLAPNPNRGSANNCNPKPITAKQIPQKPSALFVPQPQGTTHQAPESNNKVPGKKKVGVLPHNYPITLLTTYQMTTIRSMILEKILQQQDGSVKPQFSGCTFKSGWLTFNCQDSNTVNWLMANVPTLKPWSSAKLIAVDDDDVPRSVILSGFFPNKNDAPLSRIFGLIKAQNSGINTNQWHVLKRVQKNNFMQLTIQVDHLSAQYLEKNDYNISYEFGKVKLKPKNSQKPVEVEKPAIPYNDSYTAATVVEAPPPPRWANYEPNKDTIWQRRTVFNGAANVRPMHTNLTNGDWNHRNFSGSCFPQY